MHHGDTHQIVSDLLTFKAFKTGTNKLTEKAKEGIVILGKHKPATS
jgi:hypothetical protein